VQRAGRGCGRADLPLVRWDLSAIHLYSRPAAKHGLYFGRWPDPALAGRRELGAILTARVPDEPIEAAEDGCPAGWARSPFCDSVWSYTRRRTDTGDRVDKPKFTTATWQAQEAAEFLEAEQERWRLYRSEVDHERWRRAQPDRKT